MWSLTLTGPALKTTKKNEPLSGNFLADPDEAISAMLDSHGTGVEIPDEQLIEASRVIKLEEKLDILPASAGAGWGISELDSRNHLFVSVLSGRGHFGKH